MRILTPDECDASMETGFWFEAADGWHGPFETRSALSRAINLAEPKREPVDIAFAMAGAMMAGKTDWGFEPDEETGED